MLIIDVITELQNIVNEVKIKYVKIKNLRIGIFKIERENKKTRGSFYLRRYLDSIYNKFKGVSILDTITDKQYKHIIKKDIDFAIFISDKLNNTKEMKKEVIKHEYRHAIQCKKNKKAFFGNELLKIIYDTCKRVGQKNEFLDYSNLPYEKDANKPDSVGHQWIEETNNYFLKNKAKIRLFIDKIKKNNKLNKFDVWNLEQIQRKCKKLKLI